MDEIQIPHIEEHKIYKNTFLQHIGVAMTYRKITAKDAPESFEKDIKTFFERFLAPLEYDNNFFEKGIFVHADNKGRVNLALKSNGSYVSIERSKYVNFVESALPLVTLPKLFAFSVLNIKTLNNLAIRKINLFPFGATNDQQVKEASQTVYESLLSPDFNSLEITKRMDDNQYVTPVLERWFRYDIYRYQIKTGIYADRTLKGRYYLIFDSSVRYDKGMRIAEGSIDRKLIELNDRMYDLFHWSASEQVLDLMNK